MQPATNTRSLSFAAYEAEKTTEHNQFSVEPLITGSHEALNIPIIIYSSGYGESTLRLEGFYAIYATELLCETNRVYAGWIGVKSQDALHYVKLTQGACFEGHSVTWSGRLITQGDWTIIGRLDGYTASDTQGVAFLNLILEKLG